MKIYKEVIIFIIIFIVFPNVALAAERVSLGFIYGNSKQVELIDRTNGSINQVSPTCLNIDSNGNLVVTEELTKEFVNAMKDRNILVMPFLSNHWARTKGRAALRNKERITDQIVKVIEEYDLDGINVDIENLTVEDKEELTEFVRALKTKVPENIVISVSVAANPEGRNTGWQASYDYEMLGKYADYLFIMTYDEHSQGGACGPVASREFVELSIKYALQYVSKDKIVVGIPFYGRYWKDGADIGGEAVVIGAVPSVVSNNNGVIGYDKEFGEAFAKFTVDETSKKTKINGVELEEGDYIIWYQNEESIKEKLSLVNSYDLLGAGVWSLGQEKVEVWKYYKEELNKVEYVSVAERNKAEIEILEKEIETLEVSRKTAQFDKFDMKFELILPEENLNEKHYIEGKKVAVDYIETENKLYDDKYKSQSNSLEYLKKQIIIPNITHIFRLNGENC